MQCFEPSLHVPQLCYCGKVVISIPWEEEEYIKEHCERSIHQSWGEELAGAAPWHLVSDPYGSRCKQIQSNRSTASFSEWHFCGEELGGDSKIALLQDHSGGDGQGMSYLILHESACNSFLYELETYLSWHKKMWRKCVCLIWHGVSVCALCKCSTFLVGCYLQEIPPLLEYCLYGPLIFTWKYHSFFQSGRIRWKDKNKKNPPLPLSKPAREQLSKPIQRHWVPQQRGEWDLDAWVMHQKRFFRVVCSWAQHLNFFLQKLINFRRVGLLKKSGCHLNFNRKTAVKFSWPCSIQIKL